MATARHLPVALVQHADKGSAQRNLDHIEARVREAAHAGARLVPVPEP